MTIDVKLLLAVRNNVHWYTTLCGLHGMAGEVQPAYWIHHGQVPPYMSNLVTLAGPTLASAQRAALAHLIEVDGKSHFSFKDSFQCLDPTPLGFHVLFHATWIWRTPGPVAPRTPAERLDWSLVRSPLELHEWERTWRGHAANQEAREPAPIFLPALLAQEGIHFMLGRRDGVNVATAALNHSGEVVGLTNVFSDAEGVGPLFPGCVRLAHTLYPELPLVGYERDEAALCSAEGAGFEGLHGLTVWNRAPA